MKGPLVSVLVPVYNAERYLEETLESILAQHYEPFEVLVVDDGSTDRSAEIAKSFPSVAYIRQDNHGPGAARNRGIEAAAGEFIANVDADDLVPPWKLRVQVRHLLEHPGVAATLGRQEWINPPPWLKRDLVYGELDGIPLNSLLARRSALVALSGYDDEHGGDMDLLVRMRERGFEIAVLSEIVVYRRYHGENLVSSEPLHTPISVKSLKAKLDRERSADAGRRLPLAGGK